MPDVEEKLVEEDGCELNEEPEIAADFENLEEQCHVNNIMQGLIYSTH